MHCVSDPAKAACNKREWLTSSEKNSFGPGSYTANCASRHINARSYATLDIKIVPLQIKLKSICCSGYGGTFALPSFPPFPNPDTSHDHFLQLARRSYNPLKKSCKPTSRYELPLRSAGRHSADIFIHSLPSSLLCWCENNKILMKTGQNFSWALLKLEQHKPNFNFSLTRRVSTHGVKYLTCFD